MTFVDFCQLWLIFGRLLSTSVDFCRLLSISADVAGSLALHRNAKVLYVYQHRNACQMEHFRQCLNKLAATPPRRKAALIRSLLPGIETALRCGHGLKESWVALEGEGLQMSYRVFHKTVSRSRKMRKPTAASGWEK